MRSRIYKKKDAEHSTSPILPDSKGLMGRFILMKCIGEYRGV